MNPDHSLDVNTVSLYEGSNGQSVVYDTLDGSAGTAALKITSRAQGITVKAERLIGGSENCADLNNECRNISVSPNVFEVRGKYALSAKTCDGVAFTGHITGTPSQWHINLGSYSDQSGRVQTNTRLELTADSYPILVWVGNADAPSLDGPAKYKLIGFGRYGSFVRSLIMLLWGIGMKLKIA